MPLSASKKSPAFWVHAVLLALPIGAISPLLKALDTPLPDGVYSAVRGYNSTSLNCPGEIDIPNVRIKNGTISFESGGVAWNGAIDEKNGVIRIEGAGITPRPTGDLHIRGHHSRARLYSDFCGSGYFRIIR